MLRLGAEEGVTGNAVLPAAETYVECVLDAEYTAGDHTLLIGRVVALSGGSSEPDPLLFHQGRFGRLSPASSASSVEQREAAA